MPNYIDDDTALPAARVDRRPIPPGESETKFYNADFGNALLQFAEDARDAIQALQLGGGGGGVTNGAGANVLMKSDGTNAVASSLSDTSTTFSIDTDALVVNKSANKVTITHALMDGGGVSPHGSLIVYTGGVGVVPAGDGDDGGIQSFVTTTLSLDPAGTAQTLALYAGNSATKTDANGTLTNYGVLANVVGGDQNYAYYAINGDFYNAGTGQFGGLLTLASVKAGTGLDFQVADTGEVTLGSKVQAFAVVPTSGTANIAIGRTAYASGCQVTTKNTSDSTSFGGFDIGLDTSVISSIAGGLHIWRGANGGFGGDNEAGFTIAGGSGNYIVGSDVGDLCIFSTIAGKKILFGMDPSAFTISAQIDTSGVFQAKALKTGSTMGTGAQWTSGAAAPNSAVTGNVGDLYSCTTAGVDAGLWSKDSGAGTNTGWVHK